MQSLRKLKSDVPPIRPWASTIKCRGPSTSSLARRSRVRAQISRMRDALASLSLASRCSVLHCEASRSGDDDDAMRAGVKGDLLSKIELQYTSAVLQGFRRATGCVPTNPAAVVKRQTKMPACAPPRTIENALILAF